MTSTLRPQGAFLMGGKSHEPFGNRKKIEGKEIKSVEDARKYLTDEEILYYMENNIFWGICTGIEDEDVCVVAEILRILGGKGYSVAHTSRILSACEAFAERIAQFRF